MGIPRIRHLAIRSRDVDRAVRFYRDGLGFKEIGWRGNGVDLSDETLNLTILPFVDSPAPAPAEGSEQIHFGIVVDDGPSLYLRLRELGVLSVRHDIKARNEAVEGVVPAGSYKVLDPDGNVIDITANRNEWRGVGNLP
ncbi:MAG TPA: VOC family protein [Methylomirabilota bacterium]|nr:VOC family protein [Methylomirabilota bacterium]